MDWIRQVLDFLVHLDRHLDVLIQRYDTWIYLILFIVIFCETGLVITPFLPGDSLLFALGLFAHPDRGNLDLALLLFLLPIAAFSGDNVNYQIGKFLGPRVFHYEKSRFFKREHLEKTHAFFEKYGGKTIVIARFVPIVRTFAPFVAGIGRMSYPKFAAYCIFGAVFWVSFFVLGGYFFGGLEIVRKNFAIAVLTIVILSLLPAFVEFIKHRKGRKNRAAFRQP